MSDTLLVGLISALTAAPIWAFVQSYYKDRRADRAAKQASEDPNVQAKLNRDGLRDATEQTLELTKQALSFADQRIKLLVQELNAERAAREMERQQYRARLCALEDEIDSLRDKAEKLSTQLARLRAAEEE